MYKSRNATSICSGIFQSSQKYYYYQTQDIGHIHTPDPHSTDEIQEVTEIVPLLIISISPQNPPLHTKPNFVLTAFTRITSGEEEHRRTLILHSKARTQSRAY